MSASKRNQSALEPQGKEALDTLSRIAQNLKTESAEDLGPFAILVFKDNFEIATFTTYSEDEVLAADEFFEQLVSALIEELKSGRYIYAGICTDLSGTYEDGERFGALGLYLEKNTREAWSYVQPYKRSSDGILEVGDYCPSDAAAHEPLF
ncbi:MAG: hypothetical protein HY986_05290 [Candidatus Melainabacteria bacterium]|nr:hypothetical protein [Candidatus Melainabacteria bacterium]